MSENEKAKSRMMKPDRWDLIISLAVFLLCLLSAAISVSDYGLTWDESLYLDSALRLRTPLEEQGWQGWLHQLDLADKHPPLHKVGGWLMMELLGRWTAELNAARLWTGIQFALSVMLVYLLARQRLPWLASVFAALAWWTWPRAFAHAHLFALDVSIAFWSVLFVYVFWKALDRRWPVALIAGVVLGAGLSTKLNAFFFPVWIVAFLALEGIFRRRGKNSESAGFSLRKAWLHLGLACVAGAIFFFTSWPFLWKAPLAHFLEYFSFHATHQNAGVLYFGQIYYGDAIPPWHFPVVTLLVTTPLGVLALFLFGGVCLGWRAGGWGRLLLVFGLCPVILQSLPGVPKYDGVRLFLPALPFLAIWSAAGLNALIEWLKRLAGQPIVKRWLAPLMALVFLTPGVWMLGKYHPFELSSYNQLIGGLSGAAEKGFEIIYWGGAADYLVPEINRTAGQNDLILLAATHWQMAYDYKPGEEFLLREDLRTMPWHGEAPKFLSGPGRRWVALAARRSVFLKEQRRLYEQQQPVFGLRRDGVLIAALYPYPELSGELSSEPLIETGGFALHMLKGMYEKEKNTTFVIAAWRREKPGRGMPLVDFVLEYEDGMQIRYRMPLLLSGNADVIALGEVFLTNYPLGGRHDRALARRAGVLQDNGKVTAWTKLRKQE